MTQPAKPDVRECVTHHYACDCREAKLAEEITQLRREKEEAEAEIARLEKLVYVPGVWKCAKCKLSLVTTIMDASSGRVAANNEPQQCANGCGPMWRLTERDAGNDLIDQMEPLQERLAQRDATIKAVREDCELYFEHRDNGQTYEFARRILALLDKEQS